MRAAALALISIVGLAACTDPLPRCEDAFKSKHYEDAAVRCDEAFSRSGSARALTLSAWARYQLKRDAEVAALAAKLRDDARAGGLLLVAGQVEERQGRTAAARELYRLAVEREQKAQNPTGASKAAYALFRSHWADTDLRAALQSARTALAEAEKAHDGPQATNALLAVAGTLLEVGDLAGARRSLAASRSLTGVGEQERAHLLFKEALLAQAEGLSPLAAARYRQVLELTAGGKLPELRVGASLNLLELSLESGALDEATRLLEDARKALPASARNAATALWHATAQLRRAHGELPAALAALDEADKLKPADGWRWRLALERGRVHEAAGQLEQAALAYADSARGVEALRAELQLDDLKAWLLARKREPLERLFLLQARGGDARAALETAERALARTFLDAHLASASGQSREADDDSAALRADSLRALFPTLRASPLVAPAKVSEVLSALQQELALVYVEAQGTLWLLLVWRGEVTLHALGALADVSPWVDRLRQNPDDAQAAAELGTHLFPAPAKAALASRKGDARAVAVAGNGAVARLPFAALKVDGQYLAERVVLCGVPSLTALRAIRASQKQGPSGTEPVVLADAGGDLPAARAEAALLRERLHARALLGAEATRAAFLAAANASLLHLAVHSGLSPRGAWLSLAGGNVWADEVLDARVRPRTVVLSSCASAATARDEMWGSLAAAFLAAGTRTVIASLWSVNDEDTRRFMEELYRSSPSFNPAAALARAQRALIRDGLPPSRWAAFLAVGDCT